MGPLLFAVFINDLRHSLCNSNYILYADDLQIYIHFKPSDLESALGGIRGDIAAVERWAERNHLFLNARKTKAMFLGSAKYINGITTSHNIVLELSGKPIELVNQATDLGVTLTSTLNWSEHIKVSANKINSILWRLKQFKNSLTTPLRVQMVSSMIFPIFDYCAAVFTDLTGQ